MTILVTDLVGSTELNERLGDDAGERLLRSHLGEVRRLIHAHGGEVVKTTGDGLMAAFGSSLHAVECACAVQRAAYWAGRAGSEEHHVRVGLHAGETTSDEHDYYGTPVVVAQRLCDAAEPDQILVSDIVRTLVGSRGTHRFEATGALDLKGISGPTEAWAVPWTPGETPDRPAAGPRRSAPQALTFAIALVVAVVVALVVIDGARDPSPDERGIATERTVRISTKGEGGAQASSDSFRPAISGDGEVIAFASAASDLLTRREDDNEAPDVFVFLGTDLRLVSASTQGMQGDGVSDEPSLSEDGRVVAYMSDAANLVPADDNGATDVLVFTKQDETVRVSVSSDGEQARGRSFDPEISGDGRYVVFTSDAANLSVRPDTNESEDVFVHDRSTGATNRVSVDSSGTEAERPSGAPTISGDGTIVAFKSAADNLVVRDTNRVSDIFVFDRATATTTRVSVASDGLEANARSYSPDVSSDGDFVAFVSAADNLVAGDANDAPDVFLHQLSTGETTRVSLATDGTEAAGASFTPAVSEHGRFVAFVSDAPNLAGAGGSFTNVYLRDLVNGRTVLISAARGNAAPDGDSFGPSISYDGRVVVFTSFATNLVAGDTNRVRDVFRWGNG